MSAPPTMAFAESPETVLRRVMDADEELLWAGRPDPVAVVGVPRAGERSRVLQLLVIAGAIGIAYWAIESGTIQIDLSWRAFMQAGGAIYIAMAFLILVLRPILNRLGWGPEARHTRWARSQTYGITSRRLLVLVDGEIEHALGPDDFSEPRILERGNGFSDVHLKTLPSSNTGQRSSRLQQDRRRVAFRALLDAADVKRRIEDWRRAFLAAQEREVEQFLSGAGDASYGAPAPTAVRTLRNDAYGVRISVPDAWKLQVRKRRKPYGRIFLDFERWKSPEELPDWNVLKVEGDYLTWVELHLDRIRKPVLVYQQAKNSTLIRALSGELVESDPKVRHGRFEGFSITRRLALQRAAHQNTDVRRPAFQRWMMLHDGRMQIGLVLVWPEDSEPLRHTVEKVFESLEVD